jgi:hypothetical protein
LTPLRDFAELWRDRGGIALARIAAFMLPFVPAYYAWKRFR